MSKVPSVKDFLSRGEKMTYHERVEWASKIGADNKGTKELRKFITALREHAPPEQPEAEADEDFLELFPMQKRNTAAHYHEIQAAMVAAVSAKDDEAIRAELLHPCSTFNKQTTKYIARNWSNKDLLALISGKETSPKLRDLTIQNCVRFRRVKVLDAAVPLVTAMAGDATVSKWFHGCSAKVVEQLLPKFKDRPILWEKLCSYHPKSVVDVMRADFAALVLDSDPWTRHSGISALYSVWYTRLTTNRAGRALRDLYHKGHAHADLWQLWLDYPDLYMGTYYYPALLFWPELTRKIPTAVFQFALRAIHVSESYGTGHVVDNFHSLLFTKHTLPFDMVMQLIRKKMKLTQRASWGSITRSIPGAYLNYLSAAQIVEYNAVLTAYMEKVKPAKGGKRIEDHTREYKQWLGGSLAAGLTAIRKLTHKCKRSRKMHDELLGGRPYRNALATVLTTYIGFYEKHAVDPTCNRDEKARCTPDHMAGSSSKYFCTVMTVIAPFPELAMFLFRRLAHFWRKIVTRPRTENPFWNFYEYFLEQTITCIHEEAEERKAQEDTAGESTARAGISEVFGELLKTVEETTKRKAVNHHLVDCLCYVSPEDVIKAAFKIPIDEQIRTEDYEGVVNTVLTAHVLAIRHESVQDRAKQNIASFNARWSKLMQQQNHFRCGGGMRSLFRFGDLNNEDVKKQIYGATATSAAVQREAAIQTLCYAARYTADRAVVGEALSFLAQKIKNERISMRVFAVSSILEAFADKPELCILPNTVPVWYELLTDALEAPDLDKATEPESEYLGYQKRRAAPGVHKSKLHTKYPVETHPMLSRFLTISQHALDLGVKIGHVGIIDFGFELQWRMEVFNRGQAPAEEEFRVKLSQKMTTRGMTQANLWPKSFFSTACPKVLCFPTGSEANFVTAILNCYKKRVVASKPDFAKDADYIVPLIRVVGKKWELVPFLTDMVETLLNDLEKLDTDADGVYLLEPDASIIKIFRELQGLYGLQWAKNGHMLRYASALLRTRQARTVLLPWLNHMSPKKKAVPRKERAQKRDEAVRALLAISPSAIHLRFVWRHLLRFRQDLIDPFLAKQQAHRGVFYLSPGDRVPTPRQSRHFPSALGDAVEQMFGQMARRGRRQPKSIAVSTIYVFKVPVADCEDTLEAEAKAAAVVEEGRLAHLEQNAGSDSTYDHRDYFTFEAVYGLSRLLPRQLAKLSEVQLHITINKDRGMPERVKAIQRWTLYPTTSYTDVVSFLDANEKKKDFSVNLVEALIKGVMQNDEPCAALPYLMSPKLLSSDRARVAIFAVRRCMNLMPAHKMTSLMKATLTGARQRALKVTAYKEVMRLLVLRPSTRHAEMIRHEWNREQLHRDVRITIAKQCIDALEGGGDHVLGKELAWKMLEEAAVKFPKESALHAALLGIDVANNYSAFKLATSCTEIVNKPLVVEHLQEMATRQLQAEHQPMYYEKVILPLASGEHAVSDDIRHLAVAALQLFTETPESKQIYIDYLTDFSSEKLNPPSQDEKKVNAARWKMFANVPWMLNNGTVGSAICKEFLRSRERGYGRAERQQLMDHIRFLFTAYTYNYGLESFKDVDEFWLEFNTSKPKNWRDIPDMLVYVAQNGCFAEEVIARGSMYLSASEAPLYISKLLKAPSVLSKEETAAYMVLVGRIIGASMLPDVDDSAIITVGENMLARTDSDLHKNMWDLGGAFAEFCALIVRYHGHSSNALTYRPKPAKHFIARGFNMDTPNDLLPNRYHLAHRMGATMSSQLCTLGCIRRTKTRLAYHASGDPTFCPLEHACSCPHPSYLRGSLTVAKQFAQPQKILSPSERMRYQRACYDQGLRTEIDCVKHASGVLIATATYTPEFQTIYSRAVDTGISLSKHVNMRAFAKDATVLLAATQKELTTRGQAECCQAVSCAILLAAFPKLLDVSLLGDHDEACFERVRKTKTGSGYVLV